MNATTAVSNGSPQEDAIAEAVKEAYAAEGFLLDDGNRDRVMVRQRMLKTLLSAGKVLAKDERAEKAVTRGEMVRRVFPKLPDPEQFSEQDDPQLALAVWNRVNSALWSEGRTQASGPLQQLVADSLGNGYVLCRTRTGNDRVPATYITDNLACVEDDLSTPELRALAANAKAVTRDLEMLIHRQPQHAKRFLRSLDHQLKSISSTSRSQLLLAIEASSPPGSEDAEGGEEEPES